MQFHDIAVVGSGMGGSMIAALNKDKDTIIFEKEPNLGGCASTFKRYGQKFNAGATTFVGYEEGHVVKNIFDQAQCVPDIIQSDVAIRILQKGKYIDRTTDFEYFLQQINQTYPYTNNEKFWRIIKKIDEDFWSDYDLFVGKYSLQRYLKTFGSLINLGMRFKSLLFKNARDFINEMFPNISLDYLNFIDAQLLITVQATSKDVTLLTMALGLSYPFHKVYYANGGMGKLIEDLTAGIDVHSNETVNLIQKHKDYFILNSNQGIYKSKNVILNSTIYDSARLFEDKQIQKYYDSFAFSDQSAFVVYLHLQSNEEFLHHYQVIQKEFLPYSISKSFFISFSHKNDTAMCNNGYTITISTHTKANFWKNLDKATYKQKKENLQNFLINSFLQTFPNIKQNDIIRSFSATSTTYQRYIHRLNCGGEAISLKNIFNTPTHTTPFDGLYNVGDTMFSGQGWPGVALGAQILQKEINERY